MEHPDVVKLENRLNQVWEARDVVAQREAVKRELDVDEDTAPQIFYCDICKQDYFPTRVTKVESRDWQNNGLFRYWRSKHCGGLHVRLISGKIRDRFWRKSPSVCRDRRVHLLDMLQPQQTGFNMLYKHN